MQNVKQIWQETAKRLEKIYDRREAESITYLLLEDVFNIKLADVIAEESRGLDSEKLEELIGRLLNHEPIQYVTEVADFYGRKFKISPGALIPRPETEELIELIVHKNELEKPRILDIGVGSGCIGISLSLEIGGIVYGTDTSKGAIQIAQENAKRLNAEITVFQHDVLKDELLQSELDILVSNPPYIPEEDREHMNKNVLQHEPNIALFVPDSDPIVFYKRIATIGLISLKDGGKIYFEIHENFGKDVQDYLISLGYVDVAIHQDMQKKDRMISATNSTNKLL
ncbi:peptide chain release factor N(5)-glutamine methyltransferase [Ekhidna sp.]